MSPPAPLKVEVDTSDAVMLAVSMRRGIDPTAPGTLSKRFGALLLARTMAAAPVRTGLYRSKMRLVATSTRGGDSTVTVSNDSPQARRLEYGFKGVDSLGRRYNQAPRPHFGPALERTAAEYEEALAAAAVTWLDKVIEARGRKGR